MKRVVITGVAGGIGAAAADRFLEAGWEVFGQDRNRPDDAGRLTGYLQGDVADEQLWSEAVPAWLQDKGPIHALVNNAAIQITRSIMDTPLEEWNLLITTNVTAPFLAMKALIPMMAGEGAAIVNVASVHARATSVNIGAYATSKGGLVSLTRAAALELAEQNVRVNAVLPGATDTAMLRAGLGKDGTSDCLNEALFSLETRTPLGRIGRPREIAEAIYFLADPELSSFITGEALVVDGGALTRLSTE